MKKTIEEVAEEYADNYFIMQDTNYNGLEHGFLAGAKYQSEQIQDDIEEKWKKYRYQTNNEDAWMFKEWLINQFKKS